MLRLTSSKLFLLILLVGAWLTAAPTAGEAAGPDEASRPGLVIHRVQAGETLSEIAAYYDSSPETLMKINALRSADAIRPGQRLVISRPLADKEQSQFEQGDVIHVVRRGQTLSGIARQYGVSIDALKEANGLNTTTIYVGQRLRIPRGEGSAVEGGIVHVVKEGETLGGIAARYGMDIDQLLKLNGIDRRTLITVGQKLVVAPAVKKEKPKNKAAAGAKRIVVDISEQRCWRYQGEQLLNTWRCSTARPGYATRVGTFRVQSKLSKAYGSTWNIWMPYWLGIYWSGRVENGFHGLPWNATTGARTWAGLVGTPITYGCIMLDNKAMKQLWEWADIGTTVVIRR